MQLLSLLLLVGVMATAVLAARCPYTYSQRYVSSYRRCGMFGWGRCANYATRTKTAYKYCTHGGYTDWAVEKAGACDMPCGGGQKVVTYKRTCTNPAPSNGGNQCQGKKTNLVREECNTQPCPIDGGWSDFVKLNSSDCSKSCGAGIQTLTFKRSCTQPRPQFGGRGCQGDKLEYRRQFCNEQPCPIEGGWSDFTEWEDYAQCTALCGGGMVKQWRSRTCTEPAPQYGGLDCTGDNLENQTVPCNTQDCGDNCPVGEDTYIANPESESQYFRCDNGVARLMSCQPDTEWDQQNMACIHSKKSKKGRVMSGDECDSSVQYQLHADCNKYVVCVHGVAKTMSCPPGLRFNFAISACDFERNVPCLEG